MNLHKKKPGILVLIVFLMIILNGCKTQDKLQQKEGRDSSGTIKSPQSDSLNAKVKIEIISKEFQTSTAADPKGYIVIIYKLTNNTNKKIKEVEADVIIYDEHKNEIKKVKIIDNELMDAGLEKEYKGLYSFNAFSDKDAGLKNLEFKNMKFESKVLMIVYEDGTKETRN